MSSELSFKFKNTTGIKKTVKNRYVHLNGLNLLENQTNILFPLPGNSNNTFNLNQIRKTTYIHYLSAHYLHIPIRKTIAATDKI